MEKRRVTIRVGERPCRFYSDDPDEYISALEDRANEAMRQTGGNAVHAVIFLTDQLLRTEQGKEPEQREHAGKPREIPAKVKKPQKQAVKKDGGQVSVWDLLDRSDTIC